MESLKNNGEKIENFLNQLKNLQSNVDKDFKEFSNSPNTLNAEKDGEFLDKHDEELYNKQIIRSRLEDKISNLSSSMINDIGNDFQTGFQTILYNLPGVGPVFQMIFNIMGNGINLEKFYQEIITQVEQMIKKSLEDYYKNQCNTIFKNLGKACDQHKDLTQKWYDKNGIKSMNHLGKEIPQSTSSTIESDDTLTPMIHASYLDLKIKFNDAITSFTDAKYRGHVAPLLTYTSVMYVAFLRDILKYGKEMKFDDSVLNGSANTPGIKKMLNDFVNVTLSEFLISGREYTNVVNSLQEGYWITYPPPIYKVWVPPQQASWVSPPASELAHKFFLAHSDNYPQGGDLIYIKKDGVYELSPNKITHALEVYYSSGGGYGVNDYPSFRYGGKPIIPLLAPVGNAVFTMLNPNRYKRTFKIRIVHVIVREAKWNLDCYDNQVGEAGSFNQNFVFTSTNIVSDPICGNIGTVGITEIPGPFTTDKKYIRLTCIRKVNFPASKNEGYAVGSRILSVQLIDL
ncbi:proteosomal alpha-subunit 7-1 [Dictyostelium discoideum AX4]|uniref:cAMP-regulated M3R protein n=1 Tax=Dictyostelium discoideum TaxID=44689 RepID=M3R_DICDI|nr:proteosomal alpha-subunit 7-1 [Dictyostelium discoideum AX4]P11872.4 RecName: Full=cAMP-regulated M3R protein; AltName: Full=Proteasomal alpha-subunit 7-1 [Dictyostelium discoideum]EAL71523.2 proteosomal alpha-subunit 7-1 [Dictyostelium discoideum AX4]|eukprot:XP_645466.2 proteosomal alpha-subunit 7-1 [Dictyostelium discoideum AX4]